MNILGIDPGVQRMGYGVIENSHGRISYKECGVIKVAATNHQKALAELHRGFVALIEKVKPARMGIERLYFSKNKKTGLAVAEARGVIMAAAEQAGLPTIEYSPNELKQRITGYGLANKEGVAKMVRLILGAQAIHALDDATDALALAILASGERIA